MIRKLIVAAIAFGVASTAWADTWQCLAGPRSNQGVIDNACRAFNWACTTDTALNKPPCASGFWYQCMDAGENCGKEVQVITDNRAVPVKTSRLIAGKEASDRLDAQGRTGASAQQTSSGMQAPMAQTSGLTQQEIDKYKAGGVPQEAIDALHGVPKAGNNSSLDPRQPNDPDVLRDANVKQALKDLTDAQAKYDGFKSTHKGMSDDDMLKDDTGAPIYKEFREAEVEFNSKVDAAQRRVDRENRDIDKQTADAKRNRDDDKGPQPTSKGSDDDCGTGAQLNSKYGCGGTRSMIKVANGINQAGQIAGTISTQVTGAQAQNTALNAGTQSAALKGAASTQKSAGMTQFFMGAFQTMMGVMETQKGSKHSGYGKEIEKGFEKTDQGYLYTSQTGSNWQHTNGQNLAATALNGKNGNGPGIGMVGSAKANYGDRVAQAYGASEDARIKYEAAYRAGRDTGALKTAYDQAYRNYTDEQKTARREVSAAGQRMAASASGEQFKVGQEAKDAGLTSMLSGATQLGQGILNIKAAAQLEEAAKQLEATENNSGLTLAPPGQDAFPSTDPRSPTVITGNGAAPVDQNPASQDQTPTDDGSQPLGGGLPPPQDNKPNGEAPAPGKFTPGGGGAVAGGGGIGGLNGGSTQAPGPDNAEKGPTAANPYVAGTTPVSGGAGISAPPGGPKEASLSPADMMAQALGLLGKGKEEKDPNTQAYGRGRGPASMPMGNGLNLPEEDIFKIVEGGYRRQIKAGNIGG